MSDTLQLVVVLPNSQPNRNGSTDVRYASACRRLSFELNPIEMTQQMSDMLQLVVDSAYTQLHRNKLANG
jgi:hypothetical protein